MTFLLTQQAKKLLDFLGFSCEIGAGPLTKAFSGSAGVSEVVGGAEFGAGVSGFGCPEADKTSDSASFGVVTAPTSSFISANVTDFLTGLFPD